MDNKPTTETTRFQISDFTAEPTIWETMQRDLDPKTVTKHLALFLITVLTVSLAGAGFVGFEPSLFPIALPSLSDFYRGLLFAALLLGFLGVHEFGHYFAALYHQIKVTLPYFIPIPLGIGTVGAVIRIKQKINDTYKMFDVGAAGPLAGFVVSLGVLLYGFSTLPDPSFIQNFAGHEAVKEYVAQYGIFPENPPQETNGNVLIVGDTLLYSFLASFFENVPPMWEMYHYPFLFAGWLGLFFTALNLTPIGQLDGGHILYSLIGFEKHKTVARIFFAVLITLGGIEAIPFIHLSLGELDYSYGLLSWVIWGGVLMMLLRKAFRDDIQWILPVWTASLVATACYLFFVVGNITTSGSLIWVVWSFFIAYFVGIEHPPALRERELDPTRKFLGWLSMAIFVLCISPNPLYLI
ncbi:site-2 protease family protein [Fodinibius sp.]|uniref:site-2 protease family protein n=1 Tax=Fodinibius sp. TaxID=1872440 RepID=UPI002ACDF58F|nr:site-2 protease family protein [Fodinibius sp.]MDZ7659908.1 site-2 protease family protein [Fodinibius sp.]